MFPASLQYFLTTVNALFELVSSSGIRMVPAAQFFIDYFTTALATIEVLTNVRIPLPPHGAGTAYAKLAHPASGYVVASAGVLVSCGPSGRCESARIAIGGVAQGLGEALREQMIFDEDGQALSGSLMNYAIPRAADMPPMILGETVTPNPFHPFGVKGVGEAGTNGAPPAVANAVMDGLAPLGTRHIDMPYTAPKLWAAIRQAELEAGSGPA